MDLPLATIINLLEDAILCVDQNSTILLMNEAAANRFGCSRALASGRPARDFPAVANAVQHLNLGEVSGFGAASKAVRRLQIGAPDQEAVAMEAVVSCALVNGDRIYTAVLRDVSLQQQMEKAVYESRKTQAIGALASGIAHDFNNVLAAVISQIDLALHAPECPPALKEHLIYAQTSARRGAELVNKLQTFSRQSKPVFGPLDIVDVLDQVVFMLRRSIDPKVAIDAPKPADLPWRVTADSSQIIQALLNLGINARDAMPQGGRLTFTVENATFADDASPPRHPGDFVRVAVSDTGLGMPPDVLSRIFEPYYTTKDPSRGPGLGLSITAAVVAEHSGWMEVESEVGRGSRFTLFLPRSNEPASKPKQIPIADTKATEGKERILVVDDEELVRMVTKAVLAYRGYQISEAEDGEDAVEKYSKAQPPFDLVLMDLHMPRLNGYDALIRIREINPEAKAVMLSGGVQDPEEGIGQMEKVAFLHKPFENQELVRLVRQMLDSE
jgi:signal transduction histidine kinase